MFALDANTVVHVLKGKGRVGEKLKQVPPRELAVPSVVVYELEIGTLRSRHPAQRRSELSRLLGLLTLLPFDQAAAEQAARLRFALEATGQGIGPLDTLIAGTVLAHEFTLITHNTDEFARVEADLLVPARRMG